MLNPRGGVIDDLIVYYLGDDFFRMVVNASTREKDLASNNSAQFLAAVRHVSVEQRPDLAIHAVQGPQARHIVVSLVGGADRDALAKLGRFAALQVKADDGVELFVARTGYTGEDGFEILLPQDAVVAFWNRLLAAGVKPAGLGARDTLRLEAGMNLYGQDMDEDISPYEAALAWTIALDEGRDFIGRDVLEAQKAAGTARQMIGLVMDEKGVLRHGQAVTTASGQGRDPVRHLLAEAWPRASRLPACRPASSARLPSTSAAVWCRCAWSSFRSCAKAKFGPARRACRRLIRTCRPSLTAVAAGWLH